MVLVLYKLQYKEAEFLKNQHVEIIKILSLNRVYVKHRKHTTGLIQCNIYQLEYLVQCYSQVYSIV